MLFGDNMRILSYINAKRKIQTKQNKRETIYLLAKIDFFVFCLLIWPMPKKKFAKFSAIRSMYVFKIQIDEICLSGVNLRLNTYINECRF